MHYKLNPPPFPQSAGPSVVFYGSPDNDGCVLTDECVIAYGVIKLFGRQGTDQQKYVNAYFAGKKGFTPPAQWSHQIGDVGTFITDMPADALAAVNSGTSVSRPEFLVGSGAFPHNSVGQAVLPGWAYSAADVKFANRGSLYSRICEDFQHNLNVGYQG